MNVLSLVMNDGTTHVITGVNNFGVYKGKLNIFYSENHEDKETYIEWSYVKSIACY